MVMIVVLYTVRVIMCVYKGLGVLVMMDRVITRTRRESPGAGVVRGEPGKGIGFPRSTVQCKHKLLISLPKVGGCPDGPIVTTVTSRLDGVYPVRRRCVSRLDAGYISNRNIYLG
jgi:hypothetical protein